MNDSPCTQDAWDDYAILKAFSAALDQASLYGSLSNHHHHQQRNLNALFVEKSEAVKKEEQGSRQSRIRPGRSCRR